MGQPVISARVVTISSTCENTVGAVSAKAVAAVNSATTKRRGDIGRHQRSTLAAGYFFNCAAQLSTTVNGMARPVLGGLMNRKRLPSGERSQPAVNAPGGKLNRRRGVPAWN